jgi:pyruvate,water dikinase
MAAYIRRFEELTREDVSVAGGKGANLGELIHANLPVPPGFVVTAEAYRTFIEQAGLRDELRRQLARLNVDDHQALEATAQRLESRMQAASIPDAVRDELATAYRDLSQRHGTGAVSVAVRSSATMEDTKQASFAGMNRSFLNVLGEDELAQKVKGVWASLYSPRVMFYRKRLQLPGEPEIAVIVQEMVNVEKSGVAFSIDPSTGNEDTIVIEAAYGLGEVVVGGQVEPDHYAVSKPDLRLLEARVGRKPFMLTRDPQGRTVRRELPPEQAAARVLTDDEVRAVAELVLRDELHYGSPQDVEWAIAGGQAFLVQSRPVTASGKRDSAPGPGARSARQELVRGLGASPGRATGHVKVVRSPDEAAAVQSGDIMVAPMTSPDWVPFMRQAAAIVTDSGGMTSHAAIVSRELGLPSIVGTRQATSALKDGMLVTVDGAAGVVLESLPEELAEARPSAAIPVPVRRVGPVAAPVTATKLMVNLGEPELAREIAAQLVDGVGLLRAEFMILTALQGVHPRRLIAEDRGAAFVDRMVEQLRVFGQAFHPRPVIYRSTDFRTNEFRNLTGGEQYEPHEENPMIGVRGAYRYVRDPELF